MTTTESSRINFNAIKLVLLFVLPIFNISVSHSKLIINEIMSKNVSYQMYHLDNIYGFASWVELHNEGIDSIDVKGYHFSDHEGHSWECMNSTIIAPDSFLVFWFSELNKNNHTNFKLDPEGGVLTIKNLNDEIVDELEYPEGIRNISYGYNLYEKEYGQLNCPTIGSSNKSSLGLYQKIDIPQFDVKSGFYNNPFDLEIISDSSCVVYYTTDGTEPNTQKSSKYTEPIEIDKNTVVRAISVKTFAANTQDSVIQYEVISDIATASYFVSERDIKMPVVSFVTDSRYFNDDTIGIFVKGIGRYDVNSPCAGASNFWGNEKRPTYVEFFDIDKNNVLSQEIGVSNFGACSRSWFLKSIKLKPGKVYGNNKLNYSFFSEKANLRFKDLVLRNDGNDLTFDNSILIRDGFIQTLLINKMDIDHQAFQPYVVYLNGDYWGVLNLRELSNENFVYSNYGLDEDEIYIEEAMKKPQIEDFVSLRESLTNHKDYDSEEFYNEVDSLIDLNEWLNYYMVETYVGNTDWPNNNQRAWKRKSGGPWRLILYDTDFGFWGNYSNRADINNIAMAHNNIEFKTIIKNNKIRTKYLTKFIVHSSLTFNTKHVKEVLDSLMALNKDDLMYFWTNIRKKSENAFESNLDKIYEFSNKRSNYVFSYLKKYYSLGDTASLNIHSEVDGVEFVFNEEIIPTSKFSSKCFEGFDISLAPITPDGYVFDYWKITKSDTSFISYDMELIDSFHTSTTYEAVFKDDSTWNSDNLRLYLNELCITNKMYVDESRESDDWIELYNASNTPVNIGGMYISDARNNLTKWQIPDDDQAKTTIPAKGYLMLWADGEPNEGVLHTNFSLSASKRQTVTLSRMVEDTIQVLDSVRYELHQKGESYARFSYDDFGSWTKTKWLTFNAPNRLYGYDMSRQTTESDTLEDIVTDSIENMTIIKDIKTVENVLSYPNPAIDEIHFVTPWTDKTLLRIYKEERLCMVMYIQSGERVDVSTLASGVYIARLRNVKNSEEQKLLFIKK